MSMRIWLKQHSILFNMSEQAIKRFSPAKEEVMVKTDAIDGECSAALECKYPWLKGAWEAHLNNMRSFSALPRMGNGKVLFVIIPVKEQVYSFLAGEKDPALDKKYAILLEHMKKEGIPYLDLLPLFRQYADQTARRRLDSKKDYYWAVDGHWNVKGNHLAGLLVSEYILEKRIIDIPEREAKLALIRDKLTTFK